MTWPRSQPCPRTNLFLFHLLDGPDGTRRAPLHRSVMVLVAVAAGSVQAQDRAHRIGQKGQVTVHSLSFQSLLGHTHSIPCHDTTPCGSELYENSLHMIMNRTLSHRILSDPIKQCCDVSYHIMPGTTNLTSSVCLLRGSRWCRLPLGVEGLSAQPLP